MANDKLISISDVACCPEVACEPCCDRLQFAYRLEVRLTDLPVELTIVAELERCPGPLSLGDVLYSTTLLPGEKVRLYSASRNTRFTYDSESEVSYRHEQVSEETYYMSAMDRFMSDLTINENASGGSRSESEFDTEGSVSNWTSAIFGRPNVRASGNFSAESSFDFMRDLSRHAEASHERTVEATRSANSVAFGEVQSRTHAEGESESAYEASSRIFSNENRCHAVTYFAYQLVKQQTVKFRIKSVLRRVMDPAADSGVETRPLRPPSHVAVLPHGVLATDAQRIEVETSARTSAAAKQANLVGNIGGVSGGGGASGIIAGNLLRANFVTANAQPASRQARLEALRKVDGSLVEAGILDEVGGGVSAKLQAELSFEKTTCLPTQAVVIKGCIDTCNVCEPAREREIEIELERKKLENELLAKQIELLEKSQEYRCCPAGEVEDDEEDGD